MNAISLLSGWGGSSDEQQQQSALASTSTPATRATRRARRSRANLRRQLSDISDEASTTVDGRRDDAWQPEDLLKSPEAQAYEELGTASNDTVTVAHSESQFTQDSESAGEATGYPSPFATPSSVLPPSSALPAGIETEASGEDVLSQDTAMIAASSAAPLGPAASSQAPFGDNVEDTSHQHNQRLAKSRFLAQSWPAKCAVRFYILLRRFLSLFGLQLPYIQTPGIEGPSSHRSVAGLAQRTEYHPPSYTEATSAAPQRPAEKHVNEPANGQLKSRWRFPGLSSSKRRLNNPTAINTSTDNNGKSTFDATEKSESDITNPLSKSRPPGKGHARTHSRTSAAQIAVDKPKMLVLDLDETLIHSTSRMGYNGGYGNPVTQALDNRLAYKVDTSGLKVRVVEVVLDGRSVVYHVYKRPWVDFFLRKVTAQTEAHRMIELSAVSGLFLVYSRDLHGFNARICRSCHRLAGPGQGHH
jgi:hypothetical protein